MITLAETSRLIPYNHLQQELRVQNVNTCVIFPLLHLVDKWRCFIKHIDIAYFEFLNIGYLIGLTCMKYLQSNHMYYTASTDANVCSSTDVQERELEDLLIDGISAGAVGGKLDQKSRVFEVILLIFLLQEEYHLATQV